MAAQDNVYPPGTASVILGFIFGDPNYDSRAPPLDAASNLDEESTWDEFDMRKHSVIDHMDQYFEHLAPAPQEETDAVMELPGKRQGLDDAEDECPPKEGWRSRAEMKRALRDVRAMDFLLSHLVNLDRSEGKAPVYFDAMMRWSALFSGTCCLAALGRFWTSLEIDGQYLGFQLVPLLPGNSRLALVLKASGVAVAATAFCGLGVSIYRWSLARIRSLTLNGCRRHVAGVKARWEAGIVNKGDRHPFRGFWFAILYRHIRRRCYSHLYWDPLDLE
ncbi:hypothetical protein B0I35DRAFT_438205 [Stachybotrys elegans]|uniref:Uncharacterized protein n=1 Tax=Stachybotrys elegans TaxID=80388 RepID=A0A8K0SIZ6_9HYPO|nr:hypothetical protein B0I35DRAFT_438205 [Stachybotrys elegans]